ncbi:hypothetical protein [Streptomyces sp. NPDC097619]|uniref:hypothetical protein n=1 Tax=Streptomyces sp. NPDC097619 TaxID=3157228 RepID=UPI00331A080E
MLLGLLGGIDLFFSEDLEVRVNGLFLLIAAVVTVLGSSLARRPGGSATPVQWGTVIGADVAALLVSGAIAYSVLSDFASQWLLWISLLLALAAIPLAAILLYEDFASRPAATAPSVSPAPDHSAEATWKSGKLTALAAVLAAAVAVPPFWYTAVYEPGTATPVVAVENGIEDVQDTGEHIEFTMWVSVQNKGKTAVRMLTSLYEVSGTRITVNDQPTTPTEDSYDGILGGNHGSAARRNPFVDYERPEQVQAGPVGEDYAWIGPTETFKMKLRGQAPRGRFDLLRLTADVAVARADRVEVDGLRPGGARHLRTCAGTRIAEVRRPLARLGALESITESNRELVTYWAVSGAFEDESPWWPPFPWIGVAIQHAGGSCAAALAPDPDGLEDRAMVGWASTVAEATVPTKPTKPTRLKKPEGRP